MIFAAKAKRMSGSEQTPVKEEGPCLEHLTHRLAETPGEFLAQPVVAGNGQIDVRAVACDLLRDLGIKIPAGEWIKKFGVENSKATPKDVNRLRLVLLACWLLADPWFRDRAPVHSAAPKLLMDGLDELALIIKAESFITSAERREEFCRLCLALMSYRPAGESEERALDQLAALSSTERSKVVEDARKAHLRAEAVRQAMVKKAAEEAAAKASRE